jgi:hypothetical protein
MKTGQAMIANKRKRYVDPVSPRSSLANVNDDATRHLAFQVGPVRDGIVLLATLPPASLTPNYYAPLSTEEKLTVFQCMNSSSSTETTPP